MVSKVFTVRTYFDRKIANTIQKEKCDFELQLNIKYDTNE
jgi:hypothetical protein